MRWLQLFFLVSVFSRAEAVVKLRSTPLHAGSVQNGSVRPWFMAFTKGLGNLTAPSNSMVDKHLLLRDMWEIVSQLNVRNLLQVATKVVPQFRNTITHYDEALHPAVVGKVALTIDDALCRDCAGAKAQNKSLIKEVQGLLRKHGSKATFFSCSEYFEGVEGETAGLAGDGHEFGNHIFNDADGQDDWKLPAKELENHIVTAKKDIETVTGKPITWFRAPRLYYTPEMKKIVEGHGMRNVAADAYCDDWAIEDASWITQMLMRMTRSGSILVIHMPQRGFREHNLQTLDFVLSNLTAKKLQAVTLSELANIAEM